MVQWVKDLALLQLWLGFDLWPGNLPMLRAWPKRKSCFVRKDIKDYLVLFCKDRFDRMSS